MNDNQHPGSGESRWPARPGSAGTATATREVPHSAGDRAARVARITMALLFFAWLIDYIDRLVITLALPSIGKEFALNKAEQGLILTVFFITYALFQLPGGLLADRIGARKTMTLALTAWSVFTGLTGLAFSYAWLLVIRVVFGISEGIFPGASMKAVSERTTPRARMTGNGVMLASNPFGAALAVLIAGPALVAVGWRNSFFLIAGLGIIMSGILWWLLPRRLPVEQTTERAAGGRSSVRIGELLSHPRFWLFALMFCGFDIVAWGLISWAPSYLVETKGINVQTAGFLISIPSFVAAAATIAGGVVFDRFFHHEPRRLIVPAMVVTGVFLWLMMHAGTAGGFVLFESLGEAAMFLTFMPIFGLPLRLLPREVAGAASGAINFGGQAAGAITPVVMGALADAFSFTVAFMFLLFGVVLAIASALVTPQTRQAFMTTMGMDSAARTPAAV